MRAIGAAEAASKMSGGCAVRRDSAGRAAAQGRGRGQGAGAAKTAGDGCAARGRRAITAGAGVAASGIAIAESGTPGDLPELREYIRSRRAALAGLHGTGRGALDRGRCSEDAARNDIYVRYLG